MSNDWRQRLVEQIPRDQIPAFLADLQAFVSAMREGRAPPVTPLLRDHAALALEYIEPEPARLSAAAFLR